MVSPSTATDDDTALACHDSMLLLLWISELKKQLQFSNECVLLTTSTFTLKKGFTRETAVLLNAFMVYLFTLFLLPFFHIRHEDVQALANGLD